MPDFLPFSPVHPPHRTKTADLQSPSRIFRAITSYEHYLLSLLQREWEERHANRIHRWLRESRLPLEKTMDAFDRSRLPPRLNHHVRVLLEGGFLDRHENVLAFGPPGCGKTHLLCALGIALIHQGRRVLFRP